MVTAGEERVERRLLQCDPDQPAHLRAVLHHVEAADARRSRGRRKKRGQNVDGRRLAGAVRTEEAVDLTRGDGDVDSVDRARAFLVLADEAFDLDPVLLRHRPTLPPAYSGQAGSRGSFAATTGFPPRW
jgi:hypothetical protein